jgi:hypothetical protein
MPQNFMRHYYDVYCLLDDAGVQAFIGTQDYTSHKDRRFMAADNKDISKNQAFVLNDPVVRASYRAAYIATSALYFRGQPDFDELLSRIERDAARL